MLGAHSLNISYTGIDSNENMKQGYTEMIDKLEDDKLKMIWGNCLNVDLSKIDFKISENQNFIECSILAIKYLRNISNIIKKYNGGVLLVDYGYSQKKMKNTLQAISNHKFANILENIGRIDITHNISFNLFKKFINQMGGLGNNLTTQREFLLRMGIKQRAEIISKNLSFLKKTDIYYRMRRLIDDKQMGNLFKVMLIKNKKNKFKLGF